MKIYLAADHGGFDLKELIKNYLTEKGPDIEDCGNFEKVEGDDYPDWISKGAKKVSADSSPASPAGGSLGIFFGRSGAGECIVANKIKNIRAVVGFNKENVELSKAKNNANVLCIGADFTNFEQAKEFIDIFLSTPFSNEERHIRRINKIKILER